MMRRTLVVVAVAIVAITVGLYFHSTHPGSGTSAATTPTITLQAQQEGAQQRWTTTGRLSIACGAHPNVTGSASGSARSLCKALAYYASHPHAHDGPWPCTGIVSPNRVVIAGRLHGFPVRLVMGTVCNPTRALAQAVHTIYVAAFR